MLGILLALLLIPNGVMAAGVQVTSIPDPFPTVDTTYFGRWTALPSTIAFETNGGTAVSDMTSVTDADVADTTMPTTTRDGYAFSGWFDNAGLTGSAITELPAKYPANGTTYYAKWSAGSATITFEENGGTAVSDMTGTTDETIADTTMPTTTLDGYTFVNWYDNSEFTGDPITALPSAYPVGSTTYYAKWLANSSTIYFEENGGTTAADILGYTDEAVVGSLPVITREGYTFTGWFDNSGLTGDAVTALPEYYPNGSITYYAGWSADSATIAFEENGGVEISDMTGTTDEVIADTTIPTTTRDGYTFENWYDNSELTGDPVTVLPSSYPAGTTTYYAKWSADSASITFEENGGSAVTDMTGTTDETISDTTMPETTRDGYTFENWYDNSGFTGDPVTVLPTEYPVGTTTYYAKWSADESVITFVTDGSAVDTRTGNTGKTITPALSGSTSSKEGYTFVGWFTEADGAGTQVTDGDFPTTYPAGGATYYAYFTADDITITFDMGDSGVTAPASITHPANSTGHDTTMPVPENRAGYSFDGWFTTAE